MALSNLSELKASVRLKIGGDATENDLDEAIKVTESRMFANNAVILNFRPMELRSTASMSTSSRFLALPEFFLEMRRLKYVLEGDDKDIDYLSPGLLQESGQAGMPDYFTVTSQLEFERVPDEAYTIEMQYLAKIAPLSLSSPVNSTLTSYPQIYVNGCLWYLYESVESEQELAAYHEQQFYKEISGANEEYNVGKYGPAPARRTLRGIV